MSFEVVARILNRAPRVFPAPANRQGAQTLAENVQQRFGRDKCTVEIYQIDGDERTLVWTSK